MNITALARALKITPGELRDNMPKLGFDIGQKAIKINKNVANKIIKEWPRLKRQLELQNKKEEEMKPKIELGEKKTIKLPAILTVKEFSSISGLSLSVILSELMKNGIFASLNEKIDFDTAWLVGNEMGLIVEKEDETGKEVKKEENKLKNALDKESAEKLLSRPPVIVVMGHVDHGKTSLLDAIRRTNVIGGEAGGITQHIGAYQVERKGQIITFVDTPGHEAFTAMRSRGAKIADIAILVVAADDGVKPQTTEAFRIIEATGIPYVVAINKIDKPDANIEKTKQELSNKLNIIPEDWGGKAICVPISAKNGTGVDELLDMVLLAAETESENIKANPKSSAMGTVIESHVDKGAGPVATILIQNGTIRLGDQLIFKDTIIGKMKSLYDYTGKKIKEAGPATPVQIIGLKTSPEVGDVLEVGDGKKLKFKKIKTSRHDSSSFMSEHETEANENVKKINVIIKSDVLGSAGAIEESLMKINTDEVIVKIIHKGLGNITDGDIKNAEATGSKILGFNVKLIPSMEEIAREKNIEVKLYSIIYDLINDIKKEIEALSVPKYERIDIGTLKVLAIFKTEKNSQIIGGKVTQGQIESDAMFEIKRNNELIDTGKLIKLQAGKQDVNIVEADDECGMQVEGKTIIEVDDVLLFYKNKEVKKK